MADERAENLERLANRLAMLVSDDGEASNAGRAAAHFARRIGLSGGDLKAIFLAGAGAEAGAAPARGPSRGDDAIVIELEQENARVRRLLRRTEEEAQVAQRQRDALGDEATSLRAELAHARWLGRIGWLGGAVIGGALVAAGSYALVRPGPGTSATADRTTPFARIAVVRSRQTVVYAQADPGSAVLGTLSAGARLSVRQLRWNLMMQWVEVELDGRIGYVRTTDVDLS